MFKKSLSIFIIIFCVAILSGCANDDITKPIITPTVTISAAPTPTIIPITEKKHLPYSDAQSSGFVQSKLFEIDEFIEQEVKDGFPGAVLLIAKNGNIIHNAAYGYAKKYTGKNLMQPPITMQEDTIFDIASMTKVYGTMFAVMKLLDYGLLNLDNTISYYLDGYDDEMKKNITIRMLLRHNAGYDSDLRFFDDNMNYADAFYSTQRDKTISLLKTIELENTPGTKYKYSDLGYMILCQIIEKISGVTLDVFLKNNIYIPLGIENQILFNPLQNDIPPQNFAATERMGNTRDGVAYFTGIRDYTLQGEVHDEKTFYSMGGVSGHAGLFADGDALSIMCQVLLNKGQYNGVRLFSEQTAEAFLIIYDEQKYQLAFQNAQSNKYLKDFVSKTTLYHYGWTGVATVLDIENDMTIILLTNKRHSPCDWDDFEGNDNFETGKYVKIIEMVYDALE